MANNTTNSQYKKPGTVTMPTTKPSTVAATAGSPLPNLFGEGGILSTIPGITKTIGRSSTVAAAVTSTATTTTDEMEVETAKKPERESMDDIVDNIKVMNAPQKTQPTVSRTGTTHQKQAVESVRRKLDMESSAALDTAIFPQIEATIRAATSKSSSTSDDDDDDEDDDSDRDSEGNKEEEKKELSSEKKKKKTTTKTTTAKVSEPKKNLSPVPKVVTPKAAATAVVNNKRPRTATVNPTEAGVNTKQQQQKVTKQQLTEESETAKSFTSEIAQLREKKQKLDETVQAAQKQLAEYTEINKTNVHAMEEIQRIEDSLVTRKKELDAREEDIKRKEAGLEEMRAIAMKLFPKVTAASTTTAQKK